MDPRSKPNGHSIRRYIATVGRGLERCAQGSDSAPLERDDVQRGPSVPKPGLQGTFREVAGLAAFAIDDPAKGAYPFVA